MRTKFLSRRVPTHVAAAFILLTAVIGTAVAMDLTTLPAERMTVASSPIQASAFTVGSVQTQFKGFNRIDLAFTLTNKDNSSAHTANAALQLVNAAGDLLAERTVTATVGAGGQSPQKVSVTEAGIVRSYSETLFIVRQAS